MKQSPRILNLLTLIGVLLSTWLIAYGLQLRFFGGFVVSEGIFTWLTPPMRFAQWAMRYLGVIDPSELGWPLIVIGCSLLGTLAGLRKAQGWALPSLRLFALASLITLHWMNVLSILLLILASAGQTSHRLSTEDVDPGR